jgi:hypothetical protein
VPTGKRPRTKDDDDDEKDEMTALKRFRPAISHP